MNETGKLEIELNGEAFFVESGSTVKSLLEQLAADSGKAPRKFEAMAVELNSEIVPKDCFEKTTLNAGDVVEVVTLVGGG